MNIKRILLARVIALGAASFMTINQASAHAMLEDSSPKNGSVLTVAPKAIHLEMGHPAKLTMFNLLNVERKIPVNFVPSTTDAKTFDIPVPALEPGKYEVKWATLGRDGHAMTGTLSFTLSGK